MSQAHGRKWIPPRRYAPPRSALVSLQQLQQDQDELDSDVDDDSVQLHGDVSDDDLSPNDLPVNQSELDSSSKSSFSVSSLSDSTNNVVSLSLPLRIMSDDDDDADDAAAVSSLAPMAHSPPILFLDHSYDSDYNSSASDDNDSGDDTTSAVTDDNDVDNDSSDNTTSAVTDDVNDVDNDSGQESSDEIVEHPLNTICVFPCFRTYSKRMLFLSRGGSSSWRKAPRSAKHIAAFRAAKVDINLQNAEIR